MFAMEWSSALCMFLIFVVFQCNGCFGCLEKERSALLEFKASIKGHSSSSDTLLTWVDDTRSDCCTWERVKCNSTTRRVIQLSLNNTIVYSESNVSRYINESLFHPFEELQQLDLSYNFINGWQNTQGHVKLAKFDKLEVLNLHANNFKNSVLPSLGSLTSLKTLDLGFNQLEGSLSDFAQVFKNLSNLEVLVLSYNLLDDFLPLYDLRNMNKLKTLDLSQNNFSGRIPASLYSLNFIESLYLRQANLEDSISGFCQLKRIRYLDLSENKFKGTIPPCLNNLTSLERIDLSYNQLSGNFSPDFISNLSSLKYMSLSQNPLGSTLPFSSLVDHKFQLRFLSLANCNLNVSTTDLLKFLHLQYDLRQLDISNNNINGEFPNWLIENNTMLETLLLGNNSLHGHINFTLNCCNNLRSIDISNNQIQGQIQTNIGEVLSKLYYLNLTNNDLDGIIPSSFGKITNLGLLDLSSNNFSGEIPENLAINCKRLGALILSNNKLDGRILPTLFNITSLYTLRLNNNRLIGNIPNKNVIVVNLYTIDLSQNHISGKIPNWISNLTQLRSFVIHDNYFDGPIPLELCNLVNLRFVDLSKNHLTGVIPSCSNLTSLQYMHLKENKLMGSIPKAILKNSNLLSLDLKYNYLTGNIPDQISLLSNLRILLLKGNRLGGVIPRELCHLSKIGILDLSHNTFSGSIPSCFSNMTFGMIEDGETLFESRIFSGGASSIIQKYADLLDNKVLDSYFFMQYTEQEEVDFMTKKRSGSYKGDILNFMAGMDLSCNKFIGSIPLEVGHLSGIRALNFSHNQLTGKIPKALSNLKQLESMDFSYNMFSGEIPSEFINIYTLAVFTVAYNNLSGRIPDMTAQFSTFGETSYEGNPFLCGPLLHRECNTNDESRKLTPESTTKSAIDLNSFLTAFAPSYALSLLGIIFAMYINPYWRQKWFDVVDKCLVFIFSF